VAELREEFSSAFALSSDLQLSIGLNGIQLETANRCIDVSTSRHGAGTVLTTHRIICLTDLVHTVKAMETIEQAFLRINNAYFFAGCGRRSQGSVQTPKTVERPPHPGSNTGSDGLELAQKGNFAAIILDVILPGLDGRTVASLLRAENNQTPIIMLTARDTMDDIINGLDAGAEDYLTKPFSFLELLARLRSLVRRGAQPPPEILSVADLVLDTKRHEASRAGVVVPLTKTEYLLLEVLMQNPGHVVLRPEIIRKVWGSVDSIEQSSLDVYVKALRAKIDSDPAAKLIYTVRSFGYKLMQAR
jgi:DNA-binding response OmpR family regulator